MTNLIELVGTLVAGGGNALPQTLLDQAISHITAKGGTGLKLEWLAHSYAADIYVSGVPAHDVREILKTIFSTMAVDIIVQPVATRRKKFLIADMESTMIEQEMLDEIAAAIGIGEHVATITRRAMNGELDFTAALKERVGLLKGHPESLLEEVGRRVTFMPGAKTLLATMTKHGAFSWLVSGGFTGFAAPVAHELGFSEAYANRLTINDGVIAGEVMEPVLDKNTKKALLERACVEMQIGMEQTLAVGDGANDIPMLNTSNDGGGLGIAYHAKPSVRQSVAQQVNYGDLTTLLFAQGYRLDEFISSSST
jgi:phosphoserine phosphatase